MVLRTCDHCDRKFAKTEHFKRHQRSRKATASSKRLVVTDQHADTKERPYECPHCKKRFSRRYTTTVHDYPARFTAYQSLTLLFPVTSSSAIPNYIRPPTQRKIPSRVRVQHRVLRQILHRHCRASSNQARVSSSIFRKTAANLTMAAPSPTFTPALRHCHPRAVSKVIFAI